MTVTSAGRSKLSHDHRRRYGQPTGGPDGGTDDAFLYWGPCAASPMSAPPPLPSPTRAADPTSATPPTPHPPPTPRPPPTRKIFLTIKVVGWKTGLMMDVAVIDDPAAAEAALEPGRARLLAQLTEPRSAAMLAAAIGLTRQKVNYHLRTLAQHALIELVEER